MSRIVVNCVEEVFTAQSDRIVMETMYKLVWQLWGIKDLSQQSLLVVGHSCVEQREVSWF